MKIQNIVISGEIGTGTSTLARGLAEKLGWKMISFGDYFRQYVKDQNIPLWDKLKVPPEWEYKMDADFHQKLETENSLVVDGHYQGFLSRDLGNIFRILLICDPDIAQQRILRRSHTHTETVETIIKRRQGLKDSFKKLYGDADYFDPRFFNTVIDTGQVARSETLEQAYNSFIKLNIKS